MATGATLVMRVTELCELTKRQEGIIKRLYEARRKIAHSERLVGRRQRFSDDVCWLQGEPPFLSGRGLTLH
jgi:hypothetical protein